MTAEDYKTLSVITPVYNRADCIGRCLQSVATQYVPDGWRVEHVVVDDGSTDNTVEVIKALAGDNVALECFPKNRGTNAARNAAVRRAKGKWIVILDSDDEMLPGAVSTICNTVDTNPEIRHFIFSTDDTFEYHNTLGQECTLTFEDFLLEKVFGDFVHVMLRDTVLNHPFEERLRIYEGLFFLHFFRSAERILFTNKILYHRDRRRDDHVTFELHLTNNQALANKRDAIVRRLKDFRDDYSKTASGRRIMNSYMHQLHPLYVFSGNYKEARALEAQLTAPDTRYVLLRRMHLGKTLWAILKPVMRLKHRLHSKTPNKWH